MYKDFDEIIIATPQNGSIICDLLNNYRIDDKNKSNTRRNDRNHTIMNIIESIEQHKN